MAVKASLRSRCYSGTHLETLVAACCSNGRWSADWRLPSPKPCPSTSWLLTPMDAERRKCLNEIFSTGLPIYSLQVPVLQEHVVCTSRENWEKRIIFLVNSWSMNSAYPPKSMNACRETLLSEMCSYLCQWSGAGWTIKTSTHFPPRSAHLHRLRWLGRPFSSCSDIRYHHNIIITSCIYLFVL